MKTKRAATGVLAILVLVQIVAPTAPAAAACGTAGSVVFPATQVTTFSGTSADKTSLITAVTKSWQRYLAMDATGYRSYLAPSVVKQSGRWGAAGVQVGPDAIVAALPTEWSAFEHPNGIVAEAFQIRKADVWSNGSQATARYSVAVRGGARWCYTDQGLVLQSFTKIGGAWKLSFQTDAWNLDYNIATGAPGATTFPFDFAIPVNNMSAQVAFYRRFAGDPEYVTPTRASFQLKGAHFILDKSQLGGIAKITPGTPNGYAIFYVDDVTAERNRLKAAGVQFVAGTDTTLLHQGPDPYAIGLDLPTRNPFVIMQRTFTSQTAPAPTGPFGLDATDARIQTAKKIATDWLRANGSAMQSTYGSTGLFFDDTRTKVRGLEKGSTLAITLPNVYWRNYDRSSAGLAASMTATDVHVASLGTRNIVSYQMELVGTGAHPFRDTAFVTHLLNGTSKPLTTMIVQAEEHSGLALSMDYSGYPVSDLTAAETFYRDVMRLGTPYPDSGYRGWWADSGVVFGIYIAKASRDGLPRPGRASGYMSFWIPSATQTYNVLKNELGSTFPLIPAINTRRGIDPQPGYTQILATDPDGNANVFTEYTGT